MKKGSLLILLFFLFFHSDLFSFFQNVNELELKTVQSLKKYFPKNNIIVKAVTNPSNVNDIQVLTIKIEQLRIGLVDAEIFTVVYQKPKLDLNLLKKGNFKISSFASQKVNLFITPQAIEDYMQRKARSLGRKNVSVNVKFTPPFIEVTYNVPTTEISKESLSVLKEFAGKSLSGYAAFSFFVKKNLMSVTSSKVILNHFLLPNSVLSYFVKKFNPFDEIPVVAPFNYSLNNAVLQPKYLNISN